MYCSNRDMEIRVKREKEFKYAWEHKVLRNGVWKTNFWILLMQTSLFKSYGKVFSLKNIYKLYKSFQDTHFG